MTRLIALTFAVSACVLPSARATDYNWTNPAGGNWNTSSNWGAIPGVPGNPDNATLGTLAGSYTVQVTDTRSVNNFNLNYASATLNITGIWSVLGNANINAGTFNFSSGQLNILGTFTTAAGATSTWSGGVLLGNGTLFGTLNVVGSGTDMTVSGTALQNSGTIAWASGSILSGSFTTANLTNTATGVVDFKADGTSFALNTGGTGVLINFGIIRKSGGINPVGTSMGWQVDFRAGSTVNVQTGILNFTGGGTFPNGSFNLTGSGTANLAGSTFNIPAGSTFTAPAGDANLLNFTGGAFLINGTLAGTINWYGGIFSGGSLTTPGTFAGTINVFGSGTDMVVSSTNLQNSGIINWTSGGIIAYSSNLANITNLAAGLINFKSDGAAFVTGSSDLGTITNFGTIRKSGGINPVGTTVNWNVDFRVGGTVDVQIGNLNFNGGGTFPNGTFNLTGTGAANLSNGTFTVPVNSTFTAPTNGTAYLNFTGGNVFVNGTLAGTMNWYGGSYGGGSLSVPGTLAGTINVFGSSTDMIINGTNLQNTGTIAWTSGGIIAYSFNTANLTNLPSGVVDFKADGTSFILGTGGTGVLINFGTIRKSGGINPVGTNVNWQVDFRVGSTINSQIGNLNLNGGGTFPNGTFNLTGAGAANLSNGTFTVPANATFTAPSNGTAYLNFTGGNINVNGTLAGTMNWYGGSYGGGSLSVPGTLSGTINVFGSSIDMIVNGTNLQNTGTIAWTSGGILAYSFNTANLTNLPAGVVDFKADGTSFILGTGGTGVLINFGTLRKSGGINPVGTNVNWQIDFRVGSTINVQTGILNLNGGGTFPNGTFNLTGAGKANISGGSFTIPANSTFTAPTNGSAFLNFTGGTMKVNGTLAGTINFYGGNFDGGSLAVPGTLAGTINVFGSSTDMNWFGSTLVQNSGTIAWTSGGILAYSFSVVNLTNLAAGLIDFKADGSPFILGTGGAGTITNQGTMRKSAGTSTTTVAWNVVNSGSILAQIGTLNFSGGMTNTGSITLSPGASVTGSITTNSGGSINGTGTLAATTINTGGRLAPGTPTSTGVLTLGSTTITSGGIYTWKIANAGPNATTLQSINNTGSSSNTPGVQDKIIVTGNINWSTPTIEILGLPGNGFDPSKAYSWVLGTYTGTASITSPVLTTSGITPASNSQFSLTTVSNKVYLNYNPVPEPGSILLVAAGGLGFIRLVRKRIRQGRASEPVLHLPVTDECR